MERTLYSQLLEWKESTSRKPLVLRGARQVGKTYLLKLFGQQEYKQMLYINFEASPKVASFFDGDLSPEKILRDLSLHYNQAIEPASTLIFFDEIQECAPALTSLKYFQENANEYHIVSAGSLLGLKLSGAKGFPVGKVNFLTLYPLNFYEFLNAIGKEKLRQHLETLRTVEPLSLPLHEQLIELLRIYYYVGGMPEAVKHYVGTSDFKQARKIHKDILDAYLLDFSKHAPSTDIAKITATWKSIPSQLSRENKKFMYSHVEKSARSRDYEDAIEWLVDAGLVYRSQSISAPRLPLESYAKNSAFKLFLLDVGLLNTLSDVPLKTILQGDVLFREFKGALTENYVAQQLVSKGYDLFYWASKGEAEVDFIVSVEGEIFPLEVKSGTGTKQKSLQVYAKKYQPSCTYRASLLNFKQDGTFCNIPLYLVRQIGGSRT